LNSEWEDVDRPTYFGDMIESYSKLSVIHFTALGNRGSIPRRGDCGLTRRPGTA